MYLLFIFFVLCILLFFGLFFVFAICGLFSKMWVLYWLWNFPLRCFLFFGVLVVSFCEVLVCFASIYFIFAFREVLVCFAAFSLPPSILVFFFPLLILFSLFAAYIAHGGDGRGPCGWHHHFRTGQGNLLLTLLLPFLFEITTYFTTHFTTAFGPWKRGADVFQKLTFGWPDQPSEGDIAGLQAAGIPALYVPKEAQILESPVDSDLIFSAYTGHWLSRISPQDKDHTGFSLIRKVLNHTHKHHKDDVERIKRTCNHITAHIDLDAVIA